MVLVNSSQMSGRRRPAPDIFEYREEASVSAQSQMGGIKVGIPTEVVVKDVVEVIAPLPSVAGTAGECLRS